MEGGPTWLPDDRPNHRARRARRSGSGSHEEHLVALAQHESNADGVPPGLRDRLCFIEADGSGKHPVVDLRLDQFAGLEGHEDL